MDCYGQARGRNSMRAAGMAGRNNPRCLEFARGAASEGDLMHPEGWASWTACSGELFAQALDLLSAKEKPKFLSARVGAATGRFRLGWSAGEAFARNPRHLEALVALGLDLNEPSVALGLAAGGDLEGLFGLMSAGAPAPETPSRVELEQAGAGDCGRSVLLALAERMRADVSAQGLPAASAVCAWLAQGASMGARDAKGRDALKIAIASGRPLLARALLAAGASPALLDAKGRDALAYLEFSKKSELSRGRWGQAQMVESVRPWIELALERRELASCAATAPSSPRRSL